MKNYQSEGKTLTITAAADHSSGDGIIVGDLLGVAKADALSGETDAVLDLCGVFALPKNDAAVIGQGDSVGFDAALNEITTNALAAESGDLDNCATAMEGKGATTSETILVRLAPGSGAIV